MTKRSRNQGHVLLHWWVVYKSEKSLKKIKMSTINFDNKFIAFSNLENRKVILIFKLFY